LLQNKVSHFEYIEQVEILDYDTINIQNDPYLLVNFNSDVLYEFPRLHQPIRYSSQIREWIGSKILAMLGAR
jgi:hypothetical protein